MAPMATTGEIFSLPESQTRDLQRCSDQTMTSLLRDYFSSESNALLVDLERQATIGQENRWYLLCSITNKFAMEGWKTDHGTWSRRKLVSVPNTSQGNSPNYPKFVGTKTTLEFKPTNGTKAVLGMTRYNLLTTREDGDGLDLNDELSLCQTYPLQRKATGKRARAADHCDAFNPPRDEQDQEASKVDATQRSTMDVGEYGVYVPDLPSTDSSKRPKPESKHWHNFTKIYTSNPEVMYAACNHCDTMLKLKGGSSCGTGSLRHHNDACRCKPKEEEQLPGNSALMPITSILWQAILEHLEL